MTPRVLVVGAGPAGLAAAHELRRTGIQVLVLERGATVGTRWRARHDELRLNTVRMFSGLPGARIPLRYGRWVHRDDYIRYLERYARYKSIPVEFGVEVLRVDESDGTWDIETTRGTRTAECVLIATGHDQLPWIPFWPGIAESTVGLRHVASVSSPRHLVGRDVTIVGGGNSGIEWAEHLVRADAGRIWLSVRNPPNISPQQFLGVPTHGLAVALRWLPVSMKDAIATVVRYLALGDLTAYGLPRPGVGTFADAAARGVSPGIDTGVFSRSVREGRIQVVAEIDRFESDAVRLVDGSRIRPDVVLAATGYRPGLQQMLGHLGVLDTNGYPRLDRDGASARAGLYFIGFTLVIEGILFRQRGEARRIARRIRRELAA